MENLQHTQINNACDNTQTAEDLSNVRAGRASSQNPVTTLRGAYFTLRDFSNLTRFNKIAIHGTPQMAVDKEAICLSRVYSYYPKCNFPLFYV